MDLTAYEYLGEPDDKAPPTKKQVRAQRERLAMREWAREQAAAAPPLRLEQVEGLRRILAGVRERQPHELMRWQLRLFCGHVVEKHAQIAHRSTAAAFTGSTSCSECGLDPATILAARPLGLAGPAPAPAMPHIKRPDRDRLRARADKLEREAAALREQLLALDQDH